MVAQIFPRWNRLQPWFELVGAFKDAAWSGSTTYAVEDVVAVSGDWRRIFVSWNLISGF